MKNRVARTRKVRPVPHHGGKEQLKELNILGKWAERPGSSGELFPRTWVTAVPQTCSSNTPVLACGDGIRTLVDIKCGGSKGWAVEEVSGLRTRRWTKVNRVSDVPQNPILLQFSSLLSFPNSY